MRLYTDEVRAVSCGVFGSVSQCQRPDRIVDLDGWEPVGVFASGGMNFMIVRRRVWFWQTMSRTPIRAAA